ncbi:helix-turn-helix domain-containing protein [Lentiprolixibacter aurantiacus]|uniref:Helix-turn-helix domain-containing protein n=1 Tax=Lentiprolixibacter aurantiacus TaxID=2993939 RepID=A0AAE3SM80_9FLAO|nr:helix-turn-helix domain-containing protein [Lentiprolixibacter aurantiacus]MCX2718452.1 helix-turn-helix domain-containing protein [Lentiprolixibacter aurantiacus]
MQEIFEILTLLVLFQLFFVSFFLFYSRKGSRLSNYLLAFFFLSLGAGLLDYYFLISGYFESKTQYALFLNSLVILHAPLLLLYTQSLTNKNFRLKWIHLLHTLPFFIALLLLYIFYYNQSPEMQQRVLEDVSEGKDLSTIMISVFGFVYELSYLLAIRIIIKNYRETIVQQFSNLDKINLNWLTFFVNVFIIAMLASTLANILRHSQLIRLDQGAIVFGLVGLLFFISSVLLKGLHQNEIFLGAQGKSTGTENNTEESKSLLHKLNQHLTQNKPYLEAELTLNDLAAQLNVSPRQLSILINAELGKSFFDLINSYRIEEAKRRFRESTDSKLTVLEVMYAVGFNSKSSFNTAFKKYTGNTPTAYKSQFS